MLNISREQFKDIYKGTKVLKYEDIFYNPPKTQKELETNYLVSKLWRMNNIYTIVNKHGVEVTFKMNLSQHKVYADSLRHPRLIILKSRQQGISTLWLVSFFDDACTRKNLSIGLMAQGQDEAATLLTRVKLLWDKLPSGYKKLLNIHIVTDNTKALSLNNGSNIFVRTSFRSTTLQRLHISEMGKIANKYPEKAKETKTGTLQAIAPGNIAVIESTAEGDNMFKSMWDNAVLNNGAYSAKDFYPVFLSWLNDPDCVEQVAQVATEEQVKYFSELEYSTGFKLTQEQKNFWISQFRELGKDIYQEYPSTPIEAFMANKEGTYYARLYMEFVKKYNREKHNLYDPNLDVHIAVDLGRSKGNTQVHIIFQEYTDGCRIIDELTGVGLRIKNFTDMFKQKPYYKNITSIILPHDANVESQTDGKTRKQIYEEEIHHANIVVLERLPIEDGIEAVKNLLTEIYIDPKCEYIIKCILNYSKKYDTKNDRFINEPEHDEFSNGADALRYLALGRAVYIEKKRVRKSRGLYDV